MPTISDLFKNTNAHIESLGDVELRFLNYDDSGFVTQLLLEVPEGREYTARVLFHQLKTPEVTYEQFAEIPDNELRELARAFIKDNRISFEYFQESNEAEFFNNFRGAIKRQLAEFAKEILNLAKLSKDVIIDLAKAYTQASLNAVKAVQSSLTYLRSADFSKSVLGEALKTFRDLSRMQLSQLDALRPAIGPALRSFNETQLKALADISRSIPKDYPSDAFFREIKRAASQLTPSQVQAAEGTFSRKLADTVSKAIESAKDNPKAFDPVEQLVQEKIKSLPKDRISSEGLQTLIAVLALICNLIQVYFNLHQYEDSKASSEVQTRILHQSEEQTETLSRLAEAVNRIISRTEQLVPAVDPNVYYVVERPVCVKVKFTTTSPTISKLYPNQKVRLIQRKHEWIYVEYFDYLDAVPRNGWVLKKYLKILEQ